MSINLLNVLGEERITTSMLYKTSGVSGIVSSWIFGEVMIRFYIVPIERVGNSRGPKYFKWQPGPSELGIRCQWSLKDYGSIDQCVLAANITPEDHNVLIVNTDVLALPVNLDNTLTAGAVTTAQNFLETYNIPAHWINTGYTYRAVLRTVTGMFLFAQRVYAIMGYPSNPLQGLTMNTQVNDFPIPFRNAMQQAADEMGYDRSWVTGTTTLRQILKFMADEWGIAPIYFGFVTL